MHRAAIAGGALLLLAAAACEDTKSDGGGGGDAVTVCAGDADCALPTPFCVDQACVECGDSSDCLDASRPLCIAGACAGTQCSDDAGCSAAAPVCDRGLCGACTADTDCARFGDRVCGEDGACVDAPIQVEHGLIFVVDRSGSMNACALPGAIGSAAGTGCDADGNGTIDELTGASRLDVLREGVLERNWMPASARLGLVVAGASDDPSCGEPEVLTRPTDDNGPFFVSSWSTSTLLGASGGTPIAAALEAARTLADGSSGPLRAVLFVDGTPNCNIDHPMPCTCANEGGCPDAEGGATVPFGTNGELLDGRFCDDSDSTVAAVTALRDAGVRTAIVAMTSETAEIYASAAAAGDLRSPDGTNGVWSGASADAIAHSLRGILAAE